MDKMSKRKKQEEDTMEDDEEEVEEGVDIPLLPKRTKVQAQRKFAQGSSPLVTPVKEVQLDIDNTPSTTLPAQVFTQAPANQPKTEDFLTFLCFRGTSLVSRRLSDLFSNPSPVIITTPDQMNAKVKKVRKKRLTEEDLKGKIKLTKHKTSAAQLKKLKHQDQTRMRRDHPAPSTPTKVPAQKKQPASPQKEKKFNKTKDVAKKSSVVAIGPARVGSKPGAHSLRKAQMTQRERLKSRHVVCKSPSSVSSRSGLRSSGLLASGSEEGLPPRKRHKHRPLVNLSGKKGQNVVAVKRGSLLQHKKLGGGVCTVEVEKKQRGSRVEVTVSPVVSVRPSRKSKEAAAVYMEMLGNEVKHPDSAYNEDDNSSVESFPELPKARTMERRERQIREMVAAEKHRNESKKNVPHVLKTSTLPKTVASKLGSKKVTVQSLLKKRMTRSSIKQPKLRKLPMGKDETLDKRKTRAKLKEKHDPDKTKDKTESKEEEKNSEDKEETVTIRPSRAVKSVQNKTSERNESPKTRKTRSDFSPVVSIDALSPSKLSKVTMKKEEKEMVLKCNEAKISKQKDIRKNVESPENKIVESESPDDKQLEIKKNKSNAKEEKKTNSQDQEPSKTDDKVKTRTTRSIAKGNDEDDGKVMKDSEPEVKNNKKESKVANKNSNDKSKTSTTETKKEEINKIELVSQNPKNLEDKSKNDLEGKVDLSKKSLKKCKPSVKQKINFDEIVRDETFVSKNRAAKSTNEDKKLKPESQGKAKKKKDVEDSNATVFVTKVDVEKVVDSGSPLKPLVTTNKANLTENSDKSSAVKAITFEDKPKTSFKSSSSPEVLKSESTSESLSSSSIVPVSSNNSKQTKEINSLPAPVVLPKLPSSTPSKTTEENKSLVVESTKESVASKVQNMNMTSQKATTKKTELEKDEDAKASKNKTNKITQDLNVLPSKTPNVATVPESKITSVKKTNTDSDTRNSATSTKVKRVQLTPSKMIVNSISPPKKLFSSESKLSNTKDSAYSSSSILNINSNSTLKPRSRATVFVKGSETSNVSPMTQIADTFRLNFSKDLESSKKDSKSSNSLLNKKEANISESTIAELDKELSNFVKDIVKSDWDGKSFEIPLTAKPVSRDHTGSKSRKQISTIDFINSTPVKCSSSEDATIRSDKVIISPLRKLTENEIRILLAQESPMKTNDKSLVSHSTLENLSRSKVVSDSEDTVSKLCIEKITNEIISLIDPKMNTAETQDIIKKYNLNKQLHNRLTDESSKVGATQSSLTPVVQKPESLSSIKVNYTSVTTSSPLPVHRAEPIPAHKANSSATEVQKRDITSTEKLLETLGKQVTLPNQTPDKIAHPTKKQMSLLNIAPDKTANPIHKQVSLPNKVPDKTSQPFNKQIPLQNQTLNKSSQPFNKQIPLSNQTPDKNSQLHNKQLSLQNQTFDKTSHPTNRPTPERYDQLSPNNAKTEKQSAATIQMPSPPNQALPTNQRPFNKQSPVSPKLDKQTSLLSQRSELPLPPNQVPKTPDRPLWPQQRPDKHSLLATKKPAALDKQYRLSNQGSLGSSTESPLTQRVDKPSLLPSPRSGALDKQYRLSKQEADRQALFGMPKDNQPDSMKTGNLSTKVAARPSQRPSDPATLSSQAMSTPEQTTSLNLSQKATSTLSPSRLNPDVKSPATSKSSDTKSSGTSTASLASSSTPKSIPNAINRPSQTFFEVPITLSSTYQTILDSRLDVARSQVTSIATPKASPSTETPKPDSTCINNVQKADCDKSSLSRTRARSVEEDNNLIANFIKDKSATPSEKSVDTKEPNTVSSSKIAPERQIVKAFEDKYEPKSSPTKNIRKYSNLGKKAPHSKQVPKQDRNFTKSLRTKKDTNYLENYSSTDSSEDEVTSKTSKSTTRKRKTTPNSKEKAPMSDFSSDSDVEDMIEKIRKDERKKSKANTEDTKKNESTDTRKPAASIAESNKSAKSTKSDAKKSKANASSSLNNTEAKSVGRSKKEKENKAEEENKGSRRLRNKQSVLYNLESLETDSDTPDEEIIPVKRKSEETTKKRKSKKSSASENEDSEDKEAKTKKMKTEAEESVEVKPKRGRKKKPKENAEESEIDKEKPKKNDRAEESSDSDSDVKKKKTLKKRSKKQNNKQVTESSDSDEESLDKANKKSTKKRNGDTKKEPEDLQTEECGTRKNLRRKPCHLYAENLSSNSEDDLELLIHNRSAEIETQNLMNHPRKSKKILDQILAKSKVETKVKETKASRSSDETSSDENEKNSKQSKEKKSKTEKIKVTKTPKKAPLKNTEQSDASESASEESSVRKQAKTPKKDAKNIKKTPEKPQSPNREDSPAPSVESSNLKRSRRASRTQSLMIDTSSDDSEDDPLLAIAKTISRNEVRMSRRSIDLLNAKEKEILKKTETSSEEESEDESEEDKDKTHLNKKPLEDSSTKIPTKDSQNRNEVVKPIPISGKPPMSGNTSQCSSLDVSNKISSLIEKDKQKRGLAASLQDKEAAGVSSQLQQEALLRLEKQPISPATPEKKPISREQLHSSWKSAFQNLKLPKTSPSVSKRPMDRNAWIRKHAMLANSNKSGEKSKSSPFEPFRINYSRSSSPMSLSSQNSDVIIPVEGKHQHLPVPVEQTLKRMPNISPKVNKTFHFEPAKNSAAPPVAEKLLPGKIEDIPKAGNFNEQIMKWLNDSIPNDDSSCDDTNSTGKKPSRFCQDDTDTSAASSVIDKGIVSAPVQLKDIFSSPVSFTSEKISSVKVDDYKKLKQSSAEKKDIFTSPSLDRKRFGEETPEKKKHHESETDSFVSDLSSCDEAKHEKKAIFQQRRSLAERLKERQTQSSLAKIAFSPQNESSVYAFEPEPPETAPSTPFRRKPAPASSPVSPPALSKPGSPSNSSIAVQVNFESETVLECSTTQTDLGGSPEGVGEGVEGGDDGHLFYIPLGKAGQSDTSAIQGVAVKLGTEGPDQRVIMSAKLVTKPPEPSDFAKPSSVSCLVPQRRVRPFNTPIIVGTVQPMSRRPATTGTQVSPRSQHTQTPPPLTTKAPPTPPPPASSVASSTTNSVSGASTSSQSGKKSKSKSSQSTSTAANKKRAASPLPSTSSSPSPSPAAPTAVKNKTFPSKGSRAMMVEAPTYYPTEKEFQDPFEYIEKIRPSAEQFGICRIVPPSSFKPECKLNDDMRFTAYNQYVHKMLHRWGPNVKEMVAIRKYLATQSVSMQQLPVIGGIEVDLPRLYSTVQQCGGLGEVLDKKRWPRVADLMRIPRLAQDRAAKLDSIYVSYLLPYDTLGHDERAKLFDAVEAEWGTHFNASLLDQEEEEESEEEDDELDECIVKGRNMPLSTFYRIARNTMSMYFKSDNNPNDPKSHPTPAEVESEFWNHVNSRMLHICVHSASIDTGSNGCGFPTAKNSTFAKHPWNLKVLTNNSASVLRSLNNLVGVTVPTLHVGMLFSACCWYRDPHGLPWIEYLHSGASKIWYGIPDEHSTAFRSTMMSLFPHYCRGDKTIWLSSDVAMVPPGLLTEKGVSLSRLVQEPGQFVVVFPAAFTSSIATGYLVAESVYFARPSWLSTCERVFKDMQDSCEPAEFSLELLLFAIAADSRSHVDVLSRVLPMIESIRDLEVAYRSQLSDLGLRARERLASEAEGKKGTAGRKKKAVVTEEELEHECDVCRVHLPISMVENSDEDVDYCLKHGIEHLSQNPDQLKHCKLLYFYDVAELEEIITKLKEKVKTKSLKKLSEKPAA